LASADLLARSLFLEQERLALEKHGHRIPESRLYEALVTTPVPPLEPNRAVAFFRALLPTLGVDPLHFGKDLARHAFTLAVATDEHLLKVVQDFLADQLQTGQISTGPKRLKAILDLAGVTPRNPQYAEMVFRTNTMDAYAQAAQEELSARADKFPVWRYSNPDDSRSRPTHSEKNGRYYPSTVPFRQVRGIEPQDVCNCRCVAIPIYWRDWVRLRAGGAAMAPGYSDPWPTDTPAKFALRIAD
jgi:SPP1 gp7 family putative phage head morphogenesis protein